MVRKKIKKEIDGYLSEIQGMVDEYNDSWRRAEVAKRWNKNYVDKSLLTGALDISSYVLDIDFSHMNEGEVSYFTKKSNEILKTMGKGD